MGQQELLIVGIDPGITTAYAVLNLDGQILRLKSAKDLHLSKLLEEITVVGKVIIVGTDVHYNPGLIEKFAARVGAKILSPHDDMKVGLKERMTAFYKPRDDHQRDALAAALQALKQVQPLFEKVNVTLREQGKEHLADQVKEIIIRDNHNIAQAIAILEEKPSVEKIKEKRKKTGTIKYSRLTEENIRLRKHIIILEKKLHHLHKRYESLLRNMKDTIQEKTGDTLQWKDKKIQFLQRELVASKENMHSLQNDMHELEHALLETKGKIVARKLQTLDFNEVYNNLLGCDVLLVEDVNTFSEKSLAYLKDKVGVILYKTQPVQRLFSTGFSFINAKKLSLIEAGNVALAREDEIDEQRKKKDLLAAIVQEYREERESLL
ncbi:MAG: DUF460 domain-containing protein [Nanoarchaeota archaeon]